MKLKNHTINSTWAMFAAALCLALPAAALADQAASPQKSAESKKTGGVKSVEERLQRLEEAIVREPASDNWFDRIQISGLIEVEAWYEKIDNRDPAEQDEETSDLDLATVELVVDAKVAKHIDGHVMFKYEEDDVFVDEGFITLTGTEACPGYVIAGRQYLPFGNFDSHFVTDPNTLVLGETNEGAAVAGYRFAEETVDLALGAYKGRAQEVGKDSHINSLVAALVARPWAGTLLTASYTSNLAGSDSLNEVVVDPDNLDSLVGGWSASASIDILERGRLIAEYLGALESFKAGELYDAADPVARRPAAWNLELGVLVTEEVELAARYGGSDDGADFLPEKQYGAVVNWGIFPPVNLALEYLHEEFEGESFEEDSLIAQLALEF